MALKNPGLRAEASCLYIFFSHNMRLHPDTKVSVATTKCYVEGFSLIANLRRVAGMAK